MIVGLIIYFILKFLILIVDSLWLENWKTINENVLEEENIRKILKK